MNSDLLNCVPESIPAQILTERRCCTWAKTSSCHPPMSRELRTEANSNAHRSSKTFTGDRRQLTLPFIPAKKDGIFIKHTLLFSVANGYADMVLFVVFWTHQFKALGVFSFLLTLDGMFPGRVISTENLR